MISPTLDGCVILIAEDEPLIALDLALALEGAGARVVTAGAVRDALPLVESAALSAAVVDHALRDGESSGLCKRLAEQDVPFVIYSGVDGSPPGPVPFISKPATSDVVVRAVEGLLLGREPNA